MSLMTDVGEKVDSDFFKARRVLNMAFVMFGKEIFVVTVLVECDLGFWGHLCPHFREFIDETVGRVDTGDRREGREWITLGMWHYSSSVKLVFP